MRGCLRLPRENDFMTTVLVIIILLVSVNLFKQIKIIIRGRFFPLCFIIYIFYYIDNVVLYIFFLYNLSFYSFSISLLLSLSFSVFLSITFLFCRFRTCVYYRLYRELYCMHSYIYWKCSIYNGLRVFCR